MRSLMRRSGLVLAVAVILAIPAPSLAADPVGQGSQQSPIPYADTALDRLRASGEQLRTFVANGEGSYQDAVEAIKNCDENKLDDALKGLRAVIDILQYFIGTLTDEQKSLPEETKPYSALYVELGGDAKAALFELRDHENTLYNMREAAKQECAKKRQTAGGGAITQGSDVAKGHVVFVDQTTQQPIPGGQVVIVPKNPSSPQKVVDIGQDGTVEIPSHGLDDTIYFIPTCHQKVAATGAQVDGSNGTRVSTPSKTLTFIAKMACHQVNDDLVSKMLPAGTKLTECRKGEWPQGEFSQTGLHGLSWEAKEDDWPGLAGTTNHQCIITIHCYERVARLVAESVCAALNPTETVGGGGQPTEKGGGTTTVVVERDEPREIQGPAPTEPYAKSKGTWGQPYADQWALRAINWLRADGTTVLPKEGVPVTVAVIDTGVDIWHSDLLGSAWLNTDSLKKAKPERDAKGIYRDYFGWNFADGNNDIDDRNGHGTVIAGIIAARVGKGFGIAGINPWARIMPVKMMEMNGKGGSINLARAVLYAVDHGARVINLSVGGPHLTVTEQAALDYAAEQGVVVVVASGNQGIDTADFSPAGLRNVLTVAALGPDLKRPSFSNWGSTIAIAAPGVDILSLRARQTDLLAFDKPDYKPGTAVVGERYYRVTGSSFAAPMVSGAASLLFSARPELTGEQVKRMLVQSARNLSGMGRDQFTGYGLLDVEAALAADPEFFIEAQISGVEVVQEAGKTVLRVNGSATANKLKQAWIEAGKGESPTEWKKISRNLTKPVSNGAIDDLDAGNFRGEKVWILRIVVEHENGRHREGWFRLQIG